MAKLLAVRFVFTVFIISYIVVMMFMLFQHNNYSFSTNSQTNEMEYAYTRSQTTIRYITKTIHLNHTLLVYKDKPVLLYGPGENGTGVEFPMDILSKELRTKIETERDLHGFNTLLSDIVSIHRKVPDMRPQACIDIVYPDNLPPVSAVIIFRDEWPSILLRTAYSILEITPPELIKEIILVDDGSENEDLKTQVELHVASVEKLKLVRNEKSLGLMMARQKGIEATTADYFVVMDGHMEVGPGWLEPLIHRLLQEPNALLCSHVGGILQDNLMYKMDDPNDTFFDSQFPFFDPLTLDQQWMWYRQSYRDARNHSLAPLEYGTIQGMMAVMRKEYFLQLGGFDPGMKTWGTEQIELSVKVWLCGGKVEMVPCSKVAHMFRATKWSKTNESADDGSSNKRRMIEVWMAEPYKSFIMDYIRDRKYEYGDVSARHKIRIDNKCKPYQFFIDKIVELSDAFIPTCVNAKGYVYNHYTSKCLDIATEPNTTDRRSLISYSCHNSSNQYFILTDRAQIRSLQGLILDAQINENETEIIILKSPINYYSGMSYWDYREDNTIYHTATSMCLTVIEPDSVGLRDCMTLKTQIWAWERMQKDITQGCM